MDATDWITIIILIIVIIIVLLIIIFPVVITSLLGKINNKLQNVLDFFSINPSTNICNRAPAVEYPPQGFEPFVDQIYSRQNAAMLLAMSLNTTKATCTNQPPETPPGFNEPELISVSGPGQRISIPIGYWFKRPKTLRGPESLGIFAFTSSLDVGSLSDYINLNQVPPTRINGYINGMEVQKDIYLIYQVVRPFLRSIWLRNKLTTSQLVFTGHGIGAGLSVLAALDFNEDLTAHYTFSAPAIGNPVFSQQFSVLIGNSFRVVNSADLLPDLPPPVIQGIRYLQADSQTISFNRNLGSYLNNNLEAYIQEFGLVVV